MAAGPTKAQVARAMRKCNAMATESQTRTGLKCSARFIRASNGEAAVVFDVWKNGKKETVTSLQGYPI